MQTKTIEPAASAVAPTPAQALAHADQAAADRPLLGAGALLLTAGVVIANIANRAHPSRENPMDNARVFLEYAHSDTWISAHLGQFLGYLLGFAGLIALSHVLARRGGITSVAARLGIAAAVASIAVAAVMQSIDGIALKAMVDRWAQAPASQQAIAFSAAETVRWIEIAVNSVFRMLQGATYLLIGLALMPIGRAVRWLGILGAVYGAAMAARGLAVAYNGFDLSNPIYGLTSSLPSVVLLAVWMLGLAVLAWRWGRAGTPARS